MKITQQPFTLKPQFSISIWPSFAECTFSQSSPFTDHGEMVVPHSCTIRFGQRSFRSSAPSVWNDLPSELKNSDISRQGFKSSLKSWLFERAYS